MPRQSPLRITGAALLVAATLFAAGSAARSALVAELRMSKPQWALLLAPTDPVAVGRITERSLAAVGNRRPLSGAERRRLISSLREGALSRISLRLLALDAEASGDRNRARATMILADRVSRRDLPTQVWLAQDAARTGDVRMAVSHLDAALSTKPKTRPLLFPLLSQALASQEFRAALADFLKSGRPWGPPFIDYAISHAQQADPVADLLLRGKPLPGGPQMRSLQAKLLVKFISEGEVDKAVAFSREVLGATHAQLSAIDFTAATADPDLAPLTWQFPEQENLRAEVMKHGGLSIDITTDLPTTVATRVLLMEAGQYKLTQTTTQPVASTPTTQWILHCIQGSPLGQLRERAIPSQASTQTLIFEVPTGCLAVRFDLIVAAKEIQQNAEIEFQTVKLTRS